MPLADLQLYRSYTARRGFPGRRVELLLAQVALVLAQVNGNRDARLTQFLFDPPADEPETDQPPMSQDQATNEVAAIFGYAPRKRPAEQPQTQTDNRDTTDGQQPG